MDLISITNAFKNNDIYLPDIYQGRSLSDKYFVFQNFKGFNQETREILNH